MGLEEINKTNKNIKENRMLDAFASAALTGLLASPLYDTNDSIETTTGECYRIAKAMIEARKEALRCTI